MSVPSHLPRSFFHRESSPCPREEAIAEAQLSRSLGKQASAFLPCPTDAVPHMDPTENVPSPHEQPRYTEVSLFSMDNGLGRCHQQSHNTCSRVLPQSTGTASLWNHADSHPLAQSWASNSLHMNMEMSLVPLGARSKTQPSALLCPQSPLLLFQKFYRRGLRHFPSTG